MSKEQNYVHRKITENRFLATSEHDAKEKYFRLGLDQKDAGDTKHFTDIFPEHPKSEYITYENQKETAYKYFKKGYEAAIERLEQKDKDLRLDFLDYWDG